MSTLGADEEEGESIKPVSSLRSKFESLAQSKPAVPTPSVARSNTLPIPTEPDRGRVSLDVPRALPWAAAPEPSGRFLAVDDVPKTAHPDGQRPMVPPRQRPVSMGPFSPPQSPPTVNIESPLTSPPNSGEYNTLSLSLRMAPTSTPGPSVPRSPLRSRPAPPPPPSDKQPGRPPNHLTLPPLMLATPVSKKLPPPVNRSNKPLTPTTLAPPIFDSGQNGRTVPASPFTTPPSSDEGSVQGVSSLQRRQRPSEAERRANKSYFPPTPGQHVPEGRRGSSAPAAPKVQPRDRQVSMPDTIADRSDRPQDRPQLPARNPRETSPARTGRTLTPDRPREAAARRPSPCPPPRPSEASKAGRAGPEFLPPPKRVVATHDDHASTRATTAMKPSLPARAVPEAVVDSRSSSAQGHYSDYEHASADSTAGPPSHQPDASQSNRRPPKAHGLNSIFLHHDARQFDLCGRYCCTTGYSSRVYDTTTGRMLFELNNSNREIKTTAVVFRPAATAEQDGQVVWLGNNYGEIQEVDLPSQRTLRLKSNAHNGREVVKMHRFRNTVWSLDEDGRLHVWGPDEKGIPSLQLAPQTYRVSRGHTFSIVTQKYLWLAYGKDIRVYNPSGGENDFHVLMHPLHTASAGEVTSGAVVSSQLDRVYFGHSDGKVSVYSTQDYSCLSVVSVSSYRINCLAGAGDLLWAGYATGRMHVYDTRQQPWVVRKEWQAHLSSVVSLMSDRSTSWKSGHAVLASLGSDKAVCLWDGWLEEDATEMDYYDRDVEYCEFREIKAVVVTWNVGATTPGTLRAEDRNCTFFREMVQTHDPPDLIVFGFQELVDLEDKKLTAKSLFKGSKKKDSEHEHMSRQYREWRDYLSRLLEDYMPSTEPFTLVHTTNMVGLFSCIFVKSSQRGQIRDVQATEVKRGLGGLHGNKGGIMVRFLFDDTSLCFANCHLAAGQSHTSQRNEDMTAILEAAGLPKQSDRERRADHFVGGGDGSMVLDHAICVVNGDLNYRIDTMGRDTVIRAVRAGQLARLLERDQLLVSRRRHPGWRLRAFAERPITFAPTYKYDVGSDTYDTSEKARSPAWCDRILYRGPGRIRQLDYRRHDGLRVSDHRPVSGTFTLRLKRILPDRRQQVWTDCERRFVAVKRRLASDARLDYLISVRGMDPLEAQRQLRS